MRINHNISAMNTYSRLTEANNSKSKSLEKLSSGQRINKAGDDAAGLAISEKMRAQIRGLDQASRNAQDGISMIQTGEGALNESHSILQRMRELSVQSANDTNTDDDRAEMQKEINQLSSELNRIAGDTEFNTRKLFDGGLSATSVEGATIEVEKIGKNVVEASFEIEFTSAIVTGCSIAISCISAAGLTGVAGVCFTIGTVCNTAEAIADLAAQINSCSSASMANWTASSDGNKLILTSKLNEVPASINTATTGINKVVLACMVRSCGTSTASATRETEAVVAVQNKTYFSATDDMLQEGVVLKTGDVEVALWDSSKGNYTNADEFKTANNLGASVNVLDIFQAANDTADEVLALYAACVNADANSSATWDATEKRICIQSACAGTEAIKYSTVSVVGLENSEATAGNGVNFHIGANSGQSMTVAFSDMTAKGIGVTATSGGDTIETANGLTAYFTSSQTVDKGGVASEFALDISSAEKADAAQSAIDDALKLVSAERSKLGAIQNRLEHTINNLGTSSENLTSAESRIRDVDMAKEMMSFTKDNILTQAATAMLAQANQMPQGVLQLLG